MQKKWFILLSSISLVTIDGFSQTHHALPEIKTVEYNQCSSIPNFDCSTKTEKDLARLAKLKNVLEHDGWSPAQDATKDAQNGGCTGGRSTNLKIIFIDGKTDDLHFYVCSRKSTKLQDDVTDLVSSWEKSNNP